MLNAKTSPRPWAQADEYNAVQKVWHLVAKSGEAEPSAAPDGVRRYTCCSHPLCIKGSGALKKALIQEGRTLGLTLDVTETTTVCAGNCQSGPFIGMPKRRLFYHNVQAIEARYLLAETARRGRMVFGKLLLDSSKVTDGRMVFLEDENLLVLIEADHCLLEAVEYLFRFNARESCGKCFPCRFGVHKLAGLLQKMRQGTAQKPDLETIRKTTAALAQDTYCRFGAKVTAALRLVLEQKPEVFETHLEKGCGPEELRLTDKERG
jgi:(2Fe-2S) ferredoxin